MMNIQICLVLAMVSCSLAAQYQFGYAVKDPITGDLKEQQELKDCDGVNGYYKTLDADGLMRTVNYKSHPLTGFQADVRREPVGTAAVAIKTSEPIIAATAAPIGLRTAEILSAPIAAEASILKSAPLLETRIAAPLLHEPSAAVSSQSVHKIDSVAPMLPAARLVDYAEAVPAIRADAKVLSSSESTVMHRPQMIRTAFAPAAAPMLRAEFAPAAVAAAPMLRAEFAPAAAAAATSSQYIRSEVDVIPKIDIEPKLATVVKAAPARILAPSMATSYSYDLPSSAAYQSFTGHWSAAQAPKLYSAAAIAEPKLYSSAAVVPAVPKFYAATAAPAIALEDPCV